MRKIIVILGLVAFGAFLHEHFEQKKAEVIHVDYPSRQDDLLPERDDSQSSLAASGNYHCDGRKRCPQMHSCEEATWFIEHCPGMEMDGDGDGVPCERQWCR